MTPKEKLVELIQNAKRYTKEANCDLERNSKYCPNCGAQMDEGIKIPVISMEDVPKIMEEMEKTEK